MSLCVVAFAGWRGASHICEATLQNSQRRKVLRFKSANAIFSFIKAGTVFAPAL
jgi:hypothetical protein